MDCLFCSIAKKEISADVVFAYHTAPTSRITAMIAIIADVAIPRVYIFFIKLSIYSNKLLIYLIVFQ